jgi:hypothetical protein
MWDGIKHLNPFKLFSFNLNYGTPYFIAALILSLPGQILNNDTLFLMGPRLVAALSALGTVYVLYKSLKHYTTENVALTFSFLLCLTPAFWTMTHAFRPDWTLAVSILLCAYYLLKDKGQFTTSFWKGVLCYGVALATKTQAIMFLPIIMAYTFYPFLFEPFHPSKPIILNALKRLIKSLAMIITSFVIINPHVLHPVGLFGVIRRFNLELVQMTPDLGANGLTLTQRLALVSENLVATPLLFVAFLAGIWSLYILWTQKKNPELFAIILGSFPCYIFLLIISHKSNWNFLISAIPFLMFYAITPFNKVSKNLQKTILILCLCSGIYTLAPHAREIFLPNYHHSTALSDENTAFIIPLLQPYHTRIHYIGVSNSAIFDYAQLGIPFRNVRVILGLLDTWQIDPTKHEAHWSGLRKTQKKYGLSRYSIKPYYPRQALIISKDHPSESPQLLPLMLQDQTAYHFLGENKNVYVFIHKKLL